MSRLWRKFVRWLAEDELDAQAAFYHYQITEYETSWRRTTEALKVERDAYKQRYEYILNLQADIHLVQPMQPIIIRKDEPLATAYYPSDLSYPMALCLRIDHTHSPELGCWEPRNREERIKEMKDNWPRLGSSAAEVAAKGKDKEA